jgi:hypothetical protein
MLVADALRIVGGGGLDIDAVQHLVKEHAVDAVPHPAQPVRSRLPQLGDGALRARTSFVIDFNKSWLDFDDLSAAARLTSTPLMRASGSRSCTACARADGVIGKFSITALEIDNLG